jgi:hypothetical protein
MSHEWIRADTKKFRESTNLSNNSNNIIKNLKKTTSAKIFKGNDLEVSSNSVKLKVGLRLTPERKIFKSDYERQYDRKE